MKNLTDFRKTVETGLDPRLGLATLGESSLKKKKGQFFQYNFPKWNKI